jgi:hypothetical protein
MQIDGQGVMRILGVLFLTSFMPLTAYSFFKFRLKQKDAEYRRILEKLGYTGDNAPAYIPTIAKEYTASDYIMPVAFATFMTFLGSMVLIMGPSLQGRPDLSLVLIGPKLATMKFDVPGLGTKFQTMLIIAMAFSGAYVWSIQNVFRRLATVDLPPGAYYGVAVRMLFSIFIALMLYYLLMSDTQAGFMQNALPVTAFLAGMFPQRALQYIQERVQFTSQKQSEGRSDPLPLSMIEGIELFQRVRLAELGIDNAQNLAQANGIDLLLRTPFNPRVLWDWIGQARLYLYFKEDVNKLRMAGVRTIFEFKKLGREEKVLSALAKSSGISIERLGVVAGLVHDDADVEKLQEGASRLLGWDTARTT